jgi:hypothetical protein
MINEIKNVYRFKLYEECRILVNDLTDVITELKTFIDKKFYPFVKEEGKRVVVSNIEISFENNKFVWRLFDRNDLDENVIKLNRYDIEDKFPGKDEYFIEIRQTLENYPKAFYCYSFICFIDTIEHVLKGEELKETYEVFDICKIEFNGENNIVYEI